jgi:hypothetical protein
VAMEGSRTMRCRSIGMLVVTLGVPLLAVLWPLLMEAGKDSLGGSTGPTTAQAQTASPYGADVRPYPETTRSVDPFRGRDLAASTSSRSVTRETDVRSAPTFSASPVDIPISQRPATPPTLAAAMDRLSRAQAQPREVSGVHPSTVSGRLVPVSGIEEAGSVGAQPIKAWNDQSEDGRGELLAVGQAPCGRNPRSPASPTDDFSAIQHRLRQLGATYSRLETWGEGGERFRFQCRIASPRGPGSFRDFEAVDADPLQAMANVLAQVQTQAGIGQNYGEPG